MSNAIDDLGALLDEMLVPDDLAAPMNYLSYLLRSPSTMKTKAEREESQANAIAAIRLASFAQGYCQGEMSTLIRLRGHLPDIPDTFALYGLLAVGIHGTLREQLAALARAIEPLRKHAKPDRPAGRPRKDDLDPQYRAVTELVAMSPKAKHRDIVRQALDNGTLKDRVKVKGGVRTTTTLEAHMKQIGRELKKLEVMDGAKAADRRKRLAALLLKETNNILTFRPKKSARRKPN